MTKAPTPGAVLDADGWIEWHGGENPVPGQWCEVRFSDHEVLNSKSDNFQWAHKAELGWSNIIAYRLARLTPEGAYAAYDKAMEGQQGHTTIPMEADIITPPAQPEPGAGELLKIEGYRAMNRGVGFERLVERPGLDDTNPRPLTALTQAQAKIARLEGEVAEHQRIKTRLLAEGKLYVDRALSAESDAAKVRAFGEHTNWELSWGQIDEGDDCEWLVHAVNGGRSDREWKLIGRGETPLAAMSAALATKTERRA